MALTKIDDRGLKTPIDLLDSEKIRFGIGNDLEIYHDGSHSYIDNSGTGNLYLKDAGIIKVRTASFGVDNADGSEAMISAVADGAVELYHNNIWRLATSGSGVNINGDLFLGDNEIAKFGGSNDLQIYHSTDNNSYIHEAGSGSLVIKADDLYIQNAAGGHTNILVDSDGRVELAYNGTKKLETTADGVDIDGDISLTGANYNAVWDKSANRIVFADNAKAAFGSSADLQIYHDAANSRIHDGGTGVLAISGSQVHIQNAAQSETCAKFIEDGAVELYFNNLKKLETSTYGTTLTGNLFLADSADGNWGRIKVGTGEDLEILHDGTDSKIFNHTGTLAINSNNIVFKDKNEGDKFAKFIHDGAVELYYDGANKFETTSSGVSVGGGITVTTGNSILTNSSQGQLTVKAGATYPGGGIKFAGGQSGATDRGTTIFYNSDDTNLTERMRISSDGDVIIGSGGSWSYPKALNVQGSSGSILSLYNADTTSYAADTNSAIELKLLTGNTGNTTGSLEIRGIKENGTNGNNARALSFYTGSNGGSNTEKLRISSEGYVTKANNPSFVARAGAGRNDVTGTITFTSCDSGWNVSGSYDTSNSRFTAPVAGWYHFGGASGYKETDDNYNVKFMVNGAYQFEVARVIGGSNDDSWQSHSTFAWSQIYKLAKDDYVSLETAYEMHQNSTYSSFWGYLIK